MNKFRKWLWSQDYLFGHVKETIRAFQRYNFLYRWFKINRKCYGCKCKDCQETNFRKEWWYCPHLKNNICDVCCIFDSLASDYNWEECKVCLVEWKRVDITDEERMKKLGWKEVDKNIFEKDDKIIMSSHVSEKVK